MTDSEHTFRIPIQVAVYAYRNVNGVIRWLVLKRSTPTNPCWQGVTGAPYEGESLHDAALRELYEETGLRAVSIMQVDYHYTYPIPTYNKHKFASGVNEITEYIFCAEIGEADENVVLSEEHDEYRWVDADTALELLSWPENKKSLKITIKSLIDN